MTTGLFMRSYPRGLNDLPRAGEGIASGLRAFPHSRSSGGKPKRPFFASDAPSPADGRETFPSTPRSILVNDPNKTPGQRLLAARHGHRRYGSGASIDANRTRGLPASGSRLDAATSVENLAAERTPRVGVGGRQRATGNGKGQAAAAQREQTKPARKAQACGTGTVGGLLGDSYSKAMNTILGPGGARAQPGERAMS